jgi:hypothetical protein
MTHAEETKGLPSGSGFDSCFRCLGKWELEKRFRKDESDASSDAKKGQKIHKALEHSDLGRLSGSESVTADICMDTEAKMIDKYDFADASDVYWEQRLWDVDDDLNPLWSVQLDYLLTQYSTGSALLIDHKTGWGIPVPIGENWQIKAQSALVWYLHRVNEIVAILSHPHHPDTRYEEITFTAAQCAEFMVTIRGFVELIQKPDQPRTPGGVQCQHCRAKHMCPERQAWLDRVALDVRNEIRERGFTALIDRTPDERAQHYREIKQLGENCARILEQYTSMVVNDPDAVVGFRSQKAWLRGLKDEATAIEKVEREFGEKIANESMSFSLTELEEAVRRAFKLSKMKATARVEACLSDVLKWTPKKPYLVEKKFYGAHDAQDKSQSSGTT